MDHSSLIYAYVLYRFSVLVIPKLLQLRLIASIPYIYPSRTGYDMSLSLSPSLSLSLSFSLSHTQTGLNVVYNRCQPGRAECGPGRARADVFVANRAET